MAVASCTAIFFTEKAEFQAKLALVLETRDVELAAPLCKRLADIVSAARAGACDGTALWLVHLSRLL